MTDFLNSQTARQSPAAAGTLRALSEGRWWTQQRPYDDGFPNVHDSYCRACGPDALEKHRSPARLPRMICSLHHRCCACQATAELRASYKDQDIIKRAQSALHGDDPLFQVGVPILTGQPALPKQEIHWCGGRAPSSDFTFTGHGFTDGALKGGATRTARRAGWAAILADGEGRIIAGIYGPCVESFPSSLRAELIAVIRMLELALPPLVIWVDNQGVVDGWHKGKEWCCAPLGPLLISGGPSGV